MTTSLGNILLAFASLGAGLVYTAVGAGSAPVSATVLVAIGLASMAWAILVLVRDRVPAQRTSLTASIGAILAWVALAGLSSIFPEAVGGLPLVPLLASTVMLLYVAIVLAVRFRASQAAATAETGAAAATADGDTTSSAAPASTAQTTTRRTPAGRFLVGVAAGGFIVAALTTPALALTNAGEHAVPHGTHGFSQHAGH
ncbi:hypothetical protein [Plantibacter sp. YIM 135347]|uniref:hypothetical protein n=1 Tax=Plantibacter sp. YIM 135347 TaxID=3423919 RepID=UPI003D32658B